MPDEPSVSGPEVPAAPIEALNQRKPKPRPTRRARGAQRVRGPQQLAPVSEPPPVIRKTEEEQHVVGVAVHAGGAVTVTTESKGPVGYVTPPLAAPCAAIGDVSIGEEVLLDGRALCIVLGVTANGLLRLRTSDPAAMPKRCEEFSAPLRRIIKKAGAR